MSLDHGKHNEALYNELFEKKVYPDWIVTTAFYASIHYVEEMLFPTTFFSKMVNNLDEAHELVPIKSRLSRHVTRGKLLEVRLPGCYNSYEKLRKQSQIARYVNYKVSNELRDKTKEWLTNIKKTCSIV